MKSANGAKAVALPHWLQVIYLAAAEAPMTNIKALNALLAINLTLVFCAIAAVMGWSLNVELVNSVLIFEGAWLGIGTLGIIGKRATYKPSPPYAPDIEDAQAGATAEHAVPVSPQRKTSFGGRSQ